MVHNQEKNQPLKINWIKAEMIEFVDKDFKEATIQQQKKIKEKKTMWEK